MAIRAKSVMLGKYYPFFLNSRDLSTWYLYRISSTGMSDGFYPMVSLLKVGEKTGPKDFQVRDINKSGMCSVDIISTIIGKKDSNDEAIKFFREQIIEGIEGSHNQQLKKFDPEVVQGKFEFPSWEIDPYSDNYLTKLVIIELRDKLRWSKFKFYPGNFIDILVSPTQFGVLEIMGDKDSIWLEPRGLYFNSDPGMSEKLGGEFNYPKEKFTGESKASAMNRALRKAEWKSFSASIIS